LRLTNRQDRRACVRFGAKRKTFARIEVFRF
jgi:hypothetical protein